MMKGERQQNDDPNQEERLFKYSTGDRTIGMEMSQSASVASAAAEFLAERDQRKSNGNMSRTYFRRPGERQPFLVLRDGRGERSTPREEPGIYPAGPCLIRAEEWLLEPELAALYSSWMSCAEDGQAERILQRIYHRLRAAAGVLLESADGVWAAVALPYTPELAASPARLAALQDAQLDALFAAVAESQRLGSDSRVDLLAPYPASRAEFAAQREFIEGVAEQTLGHAYAAACRIGALLAPDVERAAAGEIARIADFLVLDGAAGEAAPEENAAEGFATAAAEVLAAVRRARPAAAVLAAGAPAAYALADLYEIGMSGIFCSAALRTEALLRAACLTWIARQDNTDAAAGGWQ
ncbi:hypothetical protein HQN87_24685 [Paenibacillus tritici]|uniref:PEP-utilising enzyme C-terminal domain-containing protein n=1 Tax=Paenibacillus tritici TaxID=1873425 RepID=A0ABX2DVD5_9BACL|nr:hypothetical protein [Paenibacillus tritici]NQX48532.1 hypothetical protein [Paenibacillus tritici]